MKKHSLSVFTALGMMSLLMAGCLRKPYVCSDPLGCVEVGNAESIQLGILLTLSGSNSVLGNDALQGVSIAIADKKQVFGHSVVLVKEDDQCSQAGGQQGASQLAANPKIVGVIGATCSSASEPAAKILSGVGLVLVSPSSTAPSLTDPATHQPAFLRTIYNDKAQGEAVANFAFNVLGARYMATIHDGTPYPKQLQEVACQSFEQFGGQCVRQVAITSGQDMAAALLSIAASRPDVIYYPVYTADGVKITQEAAAAGLANVTLISSDGLFNASFIQQSEPASEGMYLSGPAGVQESQDFLAKFKAQFGGEPAASYHLQAYDAAMMLFNAIEKVAVPVSSNSNGISIPRQALRQALYATQNMQGLSGMISCSPTGDCAQPNIEIFQVVNSQFKPIYP
ncbi:MAG TPA: branched-chain amino acid ABC transporter substrate-binding protein [Anaerolineales bacterium]|nr:branched-chain amino acid ABC transporter substrate-binding protein [Anaerolineales bacterium]